MGSELVLIMGDTGSGKSYSLRNIPKGECFVINTVDKRFPFTPQPLSSRGFQGYADVHRFINESVNRGVNCIVIDDATFLMLKENEARAFEKGYDKYVEMACHFGELVTHARSLKDDIAVYLMVHIDTDALGNEKMKTIGKMLDEKMLVPGEVNVVLRACCENGKYTFATKQAGLAKSPPDMFEPRIDNDLDKVDRRIREYYGMGARRNILEKKEENNEE